MTHREGYDPVDQRSDSGNGKPLDACSGVVWGMLITSSGLRQADYDNYHEVTTVPAIFIRGTSSKQDSVHITAVQSFKHAM